MQSFRSGKFTFRIFSFLDIFFKIQNLSKATRAGKLHKSEHYTLRGNIFFFLFVQAVLMLL